MGEMQYDVATQRIVNRVYDAERGECAYDKADVAYFGSGMDASVGYLTNFAHVPHGFRWNGYTWPSSEHAFQAALRVHPDDWHHFAIDGVLGNFESGMPLIFRAKDVDKKKKYYGPKKTGKPRMVGILAKMAVKPDIAKGIPLRLLSGSEDRHSLEEMITLFLEILEAKYEQCSEARMQLLATQDKYLIEFSRAAVREYRNGKVSLWAAQLDGDGIVRGRNLQGEIHMEVRDFFQGKLGAAKDETRA